jgi:uncharacterized protein YecT (DUF1311 family)
MTNGFEGKRLMTYALALLGFVAITLFANTITISIASSPSSGEQNQMELNKQACDEYKKVDAEMNRVYQTVVKDYAGDRTFIASLRKAQLAWISYRDAHLDSLYPGDASQYGSVNTMCRCNQLAELTEERTKKLKQWADGIEEGDVCAGSVKTK